MRAGAGLLLAVIALVPPVGHGYGWSTEMEMDGYDEMLKSSARQPRQSLRQAMAAPATGKTLNPLQAAAHDDKPPPLGSSGSSSAPPPIVIRNDKRPDGTRPACTITCPGDYRGEAVLHMIPLTSWMILGGVAVVAMAICLAAREAPTPSMEEVIEDQSREQKEVAAVEGGEGGKTTNVLLPNFVQFLVDNIVMQAFAASCSVFGISVLPKKFVAEWDGSIQRFVGVIINVVIVAILRKLAHFIMRKEGAIASVARHFEPELTWIIRVSFMGFIGGLMFDMDEANGWSELGSDGFGIDITGPPMGNSILCRILFFFILTYAVAHLAITLTSRPDNGKPLCSWVTFAIQICYCSALSGSGKVGYKLLDVANKAMWGPTDRNHIFKLQCMSCLLFFIVITTLPAYCFIIPRMKRSHDTAVVKSLFAGFNYVMLYVFSFGLVNLLWWFFFQYVGGGDSTATNPTNETLGVSLYWALLGCLCIFAGATCLEGSPFPIDMPNGALGTAGPTVVTLLSWTIDNMVWWGWAMMLVDFDEWVVRTYNIANMSTSRQNFIVNVIIMFLLGLIGCCITYVNRNALASAKKKFKHEHHGEVQKEEPDPEKLEDAITVIKRLRHEVADLKEPRKISEALELLDRLRKEVANLK